MTIRWENDINVEGKEEPKKLKKKLFHEMRYDKSTITNRKRQSIKNDK